MLIYMQFSMGNCYSNALCMALIFQFLIHHKISSKYDNHVSIRLCVCLYSFSKVVCRNLMCIFQKQLPEIIYTFVPEI